MKKIFAAFMAATLSVAAFAQEEVPAFPGAEGHGRYTTGGRGGKVIHVTNLNNSGTGSLRAAVSGSAKKIIVFDVAGVIPLASDLTIGDNTTIAGQTAPYPGITLRYYTVRPGANNIIRFIRIRRGQEKDINDGADALWQRQKTGMILDHCSFSWCIDEVASFYDNNNFTMQWCTVAESLVNAGHGKGAHGYGGIWGGKLASFHHNMIAHVANRSPRFNGARYNWKGYTSNKLYSQYKWENAVQAENVDFRNCVIYNCGNGCYGGPGGGQVNIVNNYYKTGPAGKTNRVTQVSQADSGNGGDDNTFYDMTSRYYINGNQVNDQANYDWTNISYDKNVPGKNGEYYSPDPNHYYGSGVTYEKINNVDCLKIKLESPIATGEVTTHSAVNAYDKVLSYAGASLYRDEVDERYEKEARNGTATYKGSVTGTYGRIDVVSDCDGYTEANFPTGSRDSNFDTDGDGIPDEWETANGLNPNDASDGNLYTLDSEKKWYTNVEVYLNSLVEDIMKAGNKDATTSIDEYYPTYTKTSGNEDNKEATLSWAFDASADIQSLSVSTNAEAAITSSSVALGSELATNSARTIGGYRLTFIKSAGSGATSDEANENNTVTFTFNLKDGYSFTPTNIGFVAARNGTDHGKFSSYWKNNDGTTIEVAEAQDAARANNVTTINKAIADAPASTGTCSLIINVFDVPSGKNFCLGNIQVKGVLGETSGISVPTVLQPLSRTYYNIGGQRIAAPVKGVNIVVERMSDGTIRSRKVVME